MHPIIALWSHPRSMSTATERLMRERGDLDCLHEPFMYDYYVHRARREMPHFEAQDDHPTRYEDIRDMLLARAEAGPVFFKDMSYYVMPQILEDRAFGGRLRNAFLIRNPIASIASYYKLDPELTLEEIGLAAQWRHLEGLAAQGQTPPVIRAEDVRNDPQGIMAALWRRLGLPYRAEAFDWQRQTPEDWAQVEGWHADVSQSKQIRPLTEAELRQQAENFEAAAAEAPHLRDFLAHEMPFHEKLSAHALTPETPP
ncbi:hypothetical protein GI374_02745 [Paracoccus sp. S-4012]|uniref:sulfotransferase-like domain-containing protein n=1 Tax=Paracoccus sp. S-4012 TaxID=2665648 RepID=UPI0012AEFC94|nr:hypothetical protein [Paracoccus sp. S-4012]MRX49380.1 hypothetical protein [Paracoccus sp. S-4012]